MRTHLVLQSRYTAIPQLPEEMSMRGLIEHCNEKTVLTIRNWGFLLFVVPPALLAVAYWLGEAQLKQNWWAFFPVFFVYGIIPVMDYIIGKDTTNPDESTTKRLAENPYFPILTLLCLPIQLACLYFGIGYVIEAYHTQILSPIGVLGWILSLGIVSSALAINVGHELIHKNSRIEQWAGGLLYASVCYAGFKVEHVRGHHVNVSTPEDASSSRFNESAYQFIPRAIVLNVMNALKLEAKRLARKGLPALHWRNELLWWHSISCALAVIAAVKFGALGAGLFLAQAMIAIIHLELINYVEHYGLERKKLPNGKYERTNITHSWNSSYLLTNLFLFQLQRHSDHHENPKRRYQILRHFDESPQLPGGYASMVLLALVPPLWRKIINPLVLSYYDHGKPEIQLQNAS